MINFDDITQKNIREHTQIGHKFPLIHAEY